MVARENHQEENIVYSETVSVKGSEKTQTYDELDEKHDLKDAKDIKDDPETQQKSEFFENEDELDIAIINDVAITDDDTTLRALTFRSIVTGFVSTYILTFSNQVLI